MNKKKLLIKALLSLGIINLIRVFIYRLQIKIHYFNKVLPISSLSHSHNLGYFYPINQVNYQKGNFQHWANQLNQSYPFFFKDQQEIQDPPNWFLNPYTQDSWAENSNKHWSEVSYFPQPGNDIKTVWELSRFYWAPWLAMAYGSTKNTVYLDKLNLWIKNWCEHNPINQGVNWLCAQEASIRAVNMILAYIILNAQPNELAREFLISHAQRIEKTMHYAYAQQNNHATSEAAALYLTGVFLGDSQSGRWKKLGRKYLETLAKKLILNDGTFAQYSVTYHRLVLDTFSLVIFSQKKYKDTEFSENFISKYQKLFSWLLNLSDTQSGDVPNLGANDGTLLFKLDSCDYRNFKPSLQLASVLLNNQRLFPEGPWDEVLELLKVDYTTLPIDPCQQTSKELADGGYVRFQGEKSFAMLNYADFKFRPSQADVFHFDLWVAGENILIDSGSYSYNPQDKQLGQLSTVQGHNTIQFDSHDQMPKLSRFLYGGWIKTKVLQPLVITEDKATWAGEYQDNQHCLHQRTVTQEKNRYVIQDDISGYKEKAVLRWHAKNIDWHESEQGWISDKVEIIIKVDDLFVKPEKKIGQASFYYHTVEDIAVFELKVLPPRCTITTIIRII